MNDTNKKQLNLNTLILFIVLGVMGWIGHTTFESAKMLSGVAAAQPLRDQAVTRVEKKLEEMASQQDSLSEQQSEQRSQIMELRMEIKNLKAK